MKRFSFLLPGLLIAAAAFAKPAGVTPEDVSFRSPGKPSHPLRLAVDIDASRLDAGEASDGRLVVRSAVPVENLEVTLRSSNGLVALSDGLAERSVSRLRADDSLALPLQVRATGTDAPHFIVVTLRAVDSSGRVMSRDVRVAVGASALRVDKRRQASDRGIGRGEGQYDDRDGGEVLVPAKQQLLRKH